MESQKAKISYFPYLPNSKSDDNKRYKYICDKIEKEPFAYHKKKNSSFVFNKQYYISLDSDLNKNRNKINQELLFFQKENDKYINSYNNFMQKKSSKIEENAENYLNYLSGYKNNLNNDQNFKNVKNNYLNYSRELPPKNKYLSKNRSVPNLFPSTSRNYNNITKVKTEKNNFIPSLVKTRGSDITNPFFYDEVAKEIMEKNQEVMAYNMKVSENKFRKKLITPKFSDDKIALAPGKIKNPNYYNLGESFLDKNPILNKGIYSPSYSFNANYFNRYKNVFGK